MNRLKQFGWFLVTIATLAIAVASFVVVPPEPKASFTIDRGKLHTEDGRDLEVHLPMLSLNDPATPGRERFTGQFTLAGPPGLDLFVLLPAPNRRVQISLNGQFLFDSKSSTMWIGPFVTSPAMVLLPQMLLHPGVNEIELLVDSGDFMSSRYIPKIYIGTTDQLFSQFDLWSLFGERVKTMSLAGHLLLGFGVMLAYFFRPKDRLLSWLAGTVAMTFVIALGFFLGFSPGMHTLLPYITVMVPAVGFLSVGVACCVSGIEPPAWTRTLAVAVPAVCMLLLLSGAMSAHATPVRTAAVILLPVFGSATAITAWGAFWRRSVEARLILPSFVLFPCFVLHDALIGFGVLHRDLVVLTPYIRPFFLLSVIALLMRRLVMSMDGLDRANENLTRRLREQEAELAALHQAEQIEAAQLVREQERLRLTQDLHDGLSGHLVSIIAMTELAGGETKLIEQAARQALDDLRLVIYSLDLGDHDLPLALANLRERITPQMQRAGVEFDWSTASLPEVSGVTPSNALSILRILQETLTNALKHGPARRIKVRGEPMDNGMFAITIENDGRPFQEGNRERGLMNMRRRSLQLGGDIRISPILDGTRVTLVLPRRLPETQDQGTNETGLQLAAPIGFQPGITQELVG